MDANTILWVAAGFIISQFAKDFFGRDRQVREEVGQMAVAIGRLETKLETWIDRVSNAATAPARSAQSPLASILETLTILEKLKGLGIAKALVS